MFKNLFSPKGRIRRLEFGISVIIVCIFGLMISGIMVIKKAPIFCLLHIPFLWFMVIETIKRCHDRGKSGWYQLIPYYFFWLLFAEGDYGKNKYGSNPKNIQVALKDSKCKTSNN